MSADIKANKNNTRNKTKNLMALAKLAAIKQVCLTSCSSKHNLITMILQLCYSTVLVKY